MCICVCIYGKICHVLLRSVIICHSVSQDLSGVSLSVCTFVKMCHELSCSVNINQDVSGLSIYY